MNTTISEVVKEVFKGEPYNITKSIRLDYDSLGNKCLYFTHGDYTKCLSLSNISNIMIKKYGTSEFGTFNFVHNLYEYIDIVDYQVSEMSMEIKYFKYTRRNG